MPADSVRIEAYAKINLSLEVIGRRDDGYHDIATILQTVDLADTLIIRPSDDLAVECDDSQLAGEANIVWDAAYALAQHAGVDPRGHIRIVKRIPVASGLGGGSADAAAALRGLNRLWGIGLQTRELAQVASRLGSDVPFLLGGGTALGTGRGDELKSLEAASGTQLLLVTPGETVPSKTPTLYRALTPSDFSDGQRTSRLADSSGLKTGNLTTGDCFNAFAGAAREIFPGLAGVWDETAQLTRRPPCLSGAGPSLFCMPSDAQELARVQKALRQSGASVRLVRTINPAQAV